MLPTPSLISAESDQICFAVFLECSGTGWSKFQTRAKASRRVRALPAGCLDISLDDLQGRVLCLAFVWHCLPGAQPKHRRKFEAFGHPQSQRHRRIKCNATTSDR